MLWKSKRRGNLHSFYYRAAGNRFVEEILAPILFIRFGLTKEHLLSRTYQRRRAFALQLVAFIMGNAI